jgi:hypothetical protein
MRIAVDVAGPVKLPRMATAYYDRYWTTDGFQPTGNTFKELEQFLTSSARPGEE